MDTIYWVSYINTGYATDIKLYVKCTMMWQFIETPIAKQALINLWKFILFTDLAVTGSNMSVPATAIPASQNISFAVLRIISVWIT